jgi:hypothetical protein
LSSTPKAALAKTKREWTVTARQKTVRATETAKTEGLWPPLMRSQQLESRRLAQPSGHHERPCGCGAEHNDERRICASRKPGTRNRSYRSGLRRNPNNRSRNPDNSCNPCRPRLRPEQSVTERLPPSRRLRLRSASACIFVNKPIVGQLGYQTQLLLVLFLFSVDVRLLCWRRHKLNVVVSCALRSVRCVLREKWSERLGNRYCSIFNRWRAQALDRFSYENPQRPHTTVQSIDIL